MASSSPTIGSFTFAPTQVLGGMQHVATWLSEVARLNGFTVYEISTPIARWQQAAAIWPVIGEPFQILKLNLAAKKALKNLDLAIVHTPGLLTSLPGLTIFHNNIYAYRQARYPRWNPNNWRLKVFNQGYDRLSSHGPRTNIALSHHQTACLRSSGVRVDEIIANPIDTTRFTPTINKSLIRQKLGWSDEKFTVLVIERFFRGKGWENVFAVAKEMPHISFRFVGPPITNLTGLPKNCQIEATRENSQLAELYQGADALLSLSEAESFGLVRAEAMSSGIPVVMTPTGLAADIQQLNTTLSKTIVLNDPKLIIKTLEKLRASPQLCQELGLLGRSFIISTCDEVVIRQKYVQLLGHIRQKLG